MKLCRFELHNEPGTVRSGLYHDGRFYETDGSQALGIHEPGAVRLHAPISHAPSLRLFEAPSPADGIHFWRSSYGHAGQIEGPGDEIEIFDPSGDWEFEVRVAAILSDSGQNIDPTEAPKWILGYSSLILLRPPAPGPEEKLLMTPSMEVDGGSCLGPFVVTPDELARLHGEAATTFTFPYEVKVNDVVVGSGTFQTPAPMAELISLASRTRSLLPGEILAWPALKLGSFDAEFGRGLLPTDKIHASIEGLGPLVLRLA